MANPAFSSAFTNWLRGRRELAASGYVSDGYRQLFGNAELREPAVEGFAKVGDGLFWRLALAVSATARERCQRLIACLP
jgi:hypothetical protein